MEEHKLGSGLTGIAKLTVSITVVLVAGLAILLVFEVIPEDVFSDTLQKILLLVFIVGLTISALALIARIGK
ncbi:MAG TPA: hypothetical protein VMR74_08540 [Gammaproteobacteria bacterium]|nr:hypothetical protein [Gammaproteobacteria bacterium]